LFDSISQVIGCEDRLLNDLDCIGWGVKLYPSSNCKNYYAMCGCIRFTAVSEQILNGTSAQIGYTVPFTLVHAGKYRTEDKLKTRHY